MQLSWQVSNEYPVEQLQELAALFRKESLEHIHGPPAQYGSSLQGLRIELSATVNLIVIHRDHI
jgi:hypothetical protein